jgi:hypothetical protein
MPQPMKISLLSRKGLVLATNHLVRPRYGFSRIHGSNRILSGSFIAFNDYSLLKQSWLPMSISMLLLLCAGMVGCSNPSHYAAPHTHLWTEDPPQNVWSYQPVTRMSINGAVTQTGGFLSRPLHPGETVQLGNGASVSFDGRALRVGTRLLPTNVLNVVIAPDGSIQENAFIRTFK